MYSADGLFVAVTYSFLLKKGWWEPCENLQLKCEKLVKHVDKIVFLILFNFFHYTVQKRTNTTVQ